MENVISIDVEQWFHRPILNKYIENIDQKSDHVLLAVRDIFKIFKKYDKRTPFFILGQVAEFVSEVVEEIKDEGHEIAFHGYSHLPLDDIGEEKFKEELKKGRDVLYHLTNESVKGFRSPMFSLSKNTPWALKALYKLGFKYDSSIFPTKTPLYGSSSAPNHIYFPSIINPEIEDDSQRALIEFPILLRQYYKIKIPAGGGFYLRLFGSKFIYDSIKSINKKGYPTPRGSGHRNHSTHSDH